MKSIKNILSTLIYAIAFLCMGCMNIIGFLRTDYEQKFILLACFLILSILTFLIGSALKKFINLKKEFGIIIILNSVFIIFTSINVYCVLQTPMREMFASRLVFFNDYYLGYAISSFLVILGIYLVSSSKKNTKNNQHINGEYNFSG